MPRKGDHTSNFHRRRRHADICAWFMTHPLLSANQIGKKFDLTGESVRRVLRDAGLIRGYKPHGHTWDRMWNLQPFAGLKKPTIVRLFALIKYGVPKERICATYKLTGEVWNEVERRYFAGVIPHAGVYVPRKLSYQDMGAMMCRLQEYGKRAVLASKTLTVNGQKYFAIPELEFMRLKKELRKQFMDQLGETDIPETD